MSEKNQWWGIEYMQNTFKQWEEEKKMHEYKFQVFLKALKKYKLLKR